MPLTMTSLAGVDPKDAGAASGLVNVMQQVGGSLGLSILVTVFGTASRAAQHHVATGVNASSHTFVYAADRVFFSAAVLLMIAVALVASMRSGRGRAATALSSASSTPDTAEELDADLEALGVA